MRKFLATCLLFLVVFSGCTAQTDPAWETHYNRRDPWNSYVSYGLTETKGGDLTGEQLAGILPKRAPDWMSATGFYKVNWLHTAEGLQRLKELDYARLELTTTLPEESIQLLISKNPPVTAAVGTEGDIPSVCNGIEYWLYEYTREGAVRTNLQAHARIGDYWFRFSAMPKPEDIPTLKEDMKAVLQSFAYLDDPDLSFLTPETQMVSPVEWTPVYNEHECGLQANRMLPEGTVKREMTDDEIGAIVPVVLRAEMETTGNVYFLADSSLYYVVLRMEYADNHATVLFGPGVDWGACCLSLCAVADGEKSRCGDAEYALYRHERPGVMFIAHGQLNEVPVLVRLDTKDPDADQPVFEKILECLSWYDANDLNANLPKP